MRRVALVLIGSLAAASPLLAQGGGIGKGTWELGAFGRATVVRPDTLLGPDTLFSRDANDKLGGGGRIGYFFARNLELELNGAYGEIDKYLYPAPPYSRNLFEIRYAPFHAQLVYNAPLSNKLYWMFGGGGAYVRLRNADTSDDFGVTGMTGLRWAITNHVHFRTEAVLDYIPSGYNSVSNTYLGVQAGLSLMLGHGCDHSGDMISIQPTSA